jgi:predicted RNA binding protein YcfA (HicA-like mRNA interferase family)
MDSKTLINSLEKNGWTLVRVKGSHHTFKHPDFPDLVTVKHPDKEVAKGTLSQIKRKSGMK